MKYIDKKEYKILQDIKAMLFRWLLIYLKQLKNHNLSTAFYPLGLRFNQRIHRLRRIQRLQCQLKWMSIYLSIRSKVKPDFMETIIYLHSPFFSIAIYFEVNGNGRKYRDKKWCGSTKDSHIMIYFVKKPFDILVCHCFRH